MSKDRMLDVISVLQQEGWSISNIDEMFDVENESVVWNLERWGSPTPVQVKFSLFSDLGQRTDQLMDILYCDVIPLDIRLYFEKRGTGEWNDSLKSFRLQMRRAAT